MDCGISAAGAVLYYLDMTKHELVGHITSISRIDESTCVLLDRFTLRNLEILDTLHEGGRSLATLLIVPLPQWEHVPCAAGCVCH